MRIVTRMQLLWRVGMSGLQGMVVSIAEISSHLYFYNSLVFCYRVLFGSCLAVLFRSLRKVREVTNNLIPQSLFFLDNQIISVSFAFSMYLYRINSL